MGSSIGGGGGLHSDLRCSTQRLKSSFSASIQVRMTRSQNTESEDQMWLNAMAASLGGALRAER